MPPYLFTLSGLSCGKCVARLTQSLEQERHREIISINRHYLKINAIEPATSIISAIEAAGFHAEIASVPDLIFNLSQVNCKNCLAKINNSLSTMPNIVHFEATLDKLKIYGKEVEASAIVQLIQGLGFSAELTSALTISSVITSSETPDEQNTITSSSTTQPMIKLRIENMSCASCVAKIEKQLLSLEGVNHVSANLAQQLVTIQTQASIQQLQAALTHIGYHSIELNPLSKATQHDSELTLYKKWRNSAIIALIASFLMMFWGMQGSNDQLTSLNQPIWLSIGGATLLLIVITGRHFFISSWRNLLHRQTTMDSLVALSVGTAWLYSACITLFPALFPATARHLYYEAALMIIGFINLGHAIEIKGKQRSSSALQHLLHLTPPTARLVQDQQETFIPLDQVTTGMILRANTGERIAVDGKVTQGEAWLNEAMLTGEPLAQYKQNHDALFAGTLIENGSVLYQANAVGAQTKLAQIIQIVEQAQSSKPKIAKQVDRIAAVFVPAVLLIALCSALLWFYIGPVPQLNYALIIFTTVLIIACPCALGLATPMSIIASIARAAQLGVLVKDASALEQAEQVKTIVFDKTGTLTKGKPEVSHVEYLQPEADVATILTLVSQLEKTTHHPLAQAILDYSAPHLPNTLCNEITHIVTHKGLGISGTLVDKKIVLGNERLMQNNQIDLSHLSENFIAHRQIGATLVYLSIGSQLIAVFAITDMIRPEAASAVAQLQQQGYKLAILTGDHEITAQYLAKKLKINHVIANLLPEDKARIIQQFQQTEGKVAMIGDGINDAPALAQANVAIAMGQGSHIAIETANIILMTDNLHKVYASLALAKQSAKNIKQNLAGAFIYNLICIPVAAGLLYPIWGILINPMWGSLAMALSSVTVITNANRLLRFNPK